MRPLIFPVFAVVALPVLAACGSASEGGGQAGASAVIAPEAETCVATFRWLQKDAYKNTGGRSTAAWPAHTTTQIDVVCTTDAGKETFSKSTFKENHGTKPGTLDANGTPFLVEVKTAEAKGTRAQLERLLGSYASCECESATQFLSMDVAKQDASMQKILGTFAQYTGEHLECSGSVSTKDVVGMMQAGDFAGAAKAMATCTWAEGYGVVDGMQQAASGTLPDLSKYHVCNNDAQLQAGLFQQFAARGEAPACDATDSVCSGPTFFYSP